jgi:DNA-binding CsgD family transcriptional regulator
MHSSRRTRGIALAGAEVNRGGIITASMDTSARSPARRVALFLLGYGAAGGLLIAALRWMEYRFLVVEHSLEIYGGLVAAVFAALGIWLGTTLTRKKPAPEVREVRVEVPAGAPFTVDQRRQKELGITPRELEILGLIAAGLSNREIAERLFVSESTVKTHSSRVFDKLGARRRTEAVRLGQAHGLLP